MQRSASRLGMVFYVSAVSSVAFVLWGVLFTQNLSDVTSALLDHAVASFGWLYLVVTTLALAFAIFLALGRHGRVRLGADDEEPEFGRWSWFAMLFAAGMGIGLVFWGVAEPASHLAEPPYGLADPGSTEAGQLAIEYAFFHWGLHPWAVYSVVALALAYFGFRRGRPALISSVFHPLLGDRVDGPLGKAIDVLAILATVFGVSVSLGLGALQANSGLGYLFEVPDTSAVQVAIIAVITAAFMLSAALGLRRGIRYASLANLALLAVLLLFLLVAGPTVFLLNVFTQATGGYLGNLLPMSFRLNAFEDGSWARDWTLFYWATWIAWSPYVGSFIARVSRGRTIREFVAGVLLVPTLLGFLWFAVFGGTALNLDLYGGAGISQAAQEDEAVALFVALDRFPLALVMSLLAIVLVSVFFVTSADSASFVLGSFSTGGSEEPATWVKLFWGALVAAFAAVLLLAGGLGALRQISVLAAVPFALIMIGMCAALYKGLSEDSRSPAEESRAGKATEKG